MGKGSGFERDQCRRLSNWWTRNKNDDVIWRNRTRRTTKTPKADKQLGDVTATNTIALPFIETFNVELKTGYAKTRKGTRHKVTNWDLLDIVDGKDTVKVLFSFWEQTIRDSIVSNRIPLLIFKRDYRNPTVCITPQTRRLIERVSKRKFKGPLLLCCGTDNINSLNLLNQELFLQWMSPRTVRKIHPLVLSATSVKKMWSNMF